MKKIFTLITLVSMSLCTWATDFKDKLAIDLGLGQTVSSDATISVTEQEDGKYTLVLKQFSFGEMLIGDVTMENVPATTDVTGVTLLETEQEAAITNGGKMAVILGGKVHLKMNGELNSSKLYANISLTVTNVGNVTATFGEPIIKNFTDKLSVTVKGMSPQDITYPEQENTISVVNQGEGKYTLALKNFVLGSGKSMMPVGTIVMKDIDGTESDGTVKLSSEQTVNIQAGDDSSVPTWMLAGTPVKVKIDAEMTDSKLKAQLNIVCEMGEGVALNIAVMFGDNSSTGINSAATESDTTVKAIYDLNGHRLNGLQKGVNIVRYSNGKTAKVVKK